MTNTNTIIHTARARRRHSHRPRPFFLRTEAPDTCQTDHKKTALKRPCARLLVPPCLGVDGSVGGASGASKNRRQPNLQDGAQTSVSRAGPGSKRRRGGGGWQRFGTRLASAKPSHVDDLVVSARQKLTSGAPRGLRRTVEKSTLRTPGRGREGRLGLWVARGHQRAAQKPICALLGGDGCCRPPTEGPVANPGRLAGRLKKELASWLPSASEAPGPSRATPARAGPFST